MAIASSESHPEVDKTLPPFCAYMLGFRFAAVKPAL